MQGCTFFVIFSDAFKLVRTLYCKLRLFFGLADIALGVPLTFQLVRKIQSALDFASFA